jgi:hypothetical protein
MSASDRATLCALVRLERDAERASNEHAYAEHDDPALERRARDARAAVVAFAERTLSRAEHDERRGAAVVRAARRPTHARAPRRTRRAVRRASSSTSDGEPASPFLITTANAPYLPLTVDQRTALDRVAALPRAVRDRLGHDDIDHVLRGAS